MSNDSNSNNELDSQHSLDRLKKQLDDMEYTELINSISDDDLKEKGIINNNASGNNFGDKKFTTEKEQLVFEPKIDFYRIEKDVSFKDLHIEDYLFVKDIDQGVLIATHESDSDSPITVGENILTKTKDNVTYYFSGKHGKVLIINETLCVLPSDEDYKVTITVSEDKLTVKADITPNFGSGKELMAEHVKNILRQSKIIFGIADKEIESAVATANQQKKTITGVIVAKGIEPVNGKDGFIQCDFDKDSKDYNFTILPDGRIDYRNIKNIPMAKKNERVAFLVNPTEGSKGTDVYGKTLLPTTGKPATLVAGNGTVLNPKTNEVFALINGTVVVNGSIIEVMDSYVVQGDVDYSTGNINFTGNVIVNGTVLEGFEIKAGGDIIVAKNVESSRIEAGRDIIIMGGILGKGKGLIASGRDIKANYVQNARLEAQGNIIIRNFAVNSYLFTAKSLILEEQRGSIIGGEAYAQLCIQLKHLGSPAGTKTYVEVGTDYLLKRKISELEEIILFCTQNINKIESSLKVVAMESAKSQDQISSQKNALIKKALDKKNELENRLRLVSARKKDLEEQLFVKDSCCIKIKENCYTDVTIRIRDKKIKLENPRSHITICDNRTSDSLLITPY